MKNGVIRVNHDDDGDYDKCDDYGDKSDEDCYDRWS